MGEYRPVALFEFKCEQCGVTFLRSPCGQPKYCSKCRKIREKAGKDEYLKRKREEKKDENISKLY